ncbi:hypothetical protein EHS13_08015 [Paenibacillus psychroresistens]|uniref:GNAT family N-acetyltransferase n=1 Tax=Paenibacillus psychroresistens TaxID=1778678 RepID=A0A6B8RGV5_9BACL|nr:hypothetical protein [Paenibacillus psychroresistens]QGQ94825.1 hypothetical protein EHS13_08015 [Paenibacillus psychroresistens]
MSSLIRKAATEDIPFLKELIVQLGSPDVSEQIIANRLQMVEGNSLDRMFVYEENNLVQGAIVLRIRENLSAGV